jgi:acyl-CoA reductase-like NAD-dependent aldehyde dehydrogenase
MRLHLTRPRASAAGKLKRLTLELGGNDAAIVVGDIDPKDVAPKVYGAAMANAGQACVAIKRRTCIWPTAAACCARFLVAATGFWTGTSLSTSVFRPQNGYV